MQLKKKRRYSSFQVILLGFAGLILTGTLLLMLPFASVKEGSASFLDALFTATSATCVTGLVVQDTATYWTMFGQFIILLMIQIGGMGVVTAAIALTTLSGKKIGLMQRSTLQESIAAPQVGGIVRLSRFIVKGMFLIELIGAIAMFPVFYRDFGLAKGIWYAVFHSISAFCNAGFDLMGVRAKFSSLTSYDLNPLINLCVIALIITGGIGFLVWEDIVHHRFKFRKYRMQTKVVIVTSALLIVLPTLFYYFYDFSRPIWKGYSGGEKLLLSLFQAVSPRTAGFNTVDLNLLSGPGRGIMIILMLIGGSPGSTAGGMKTTTLAVALSTMIAVFRRQESSRFFGRRVPNETVRYAMAVLMMYLVLFLFGTVALSCLDGCSLGQSAFEAASAIGTVGLTLGITPGLCTASHLILVLLMFFGRVGGLTIIFAAVSGTRSNLSEVPKEKITVG